MKLSPSKSEYYIEKLSLCSTVRKYLFVSLTKFAIVLICCLSLRFNQINHSYFIIQTGRYSTSMNNIFRYSKSFLLVLAILMVLFLPSVVNLQIDSITPTSGSLRGGTTITIGGIFDSNSIIEDYTITIGDYPCNITTGGASSTFLTCTTIDTGSQSNINNQLIRIDYKGSAVYADYRFSFITTSTPQILKVVPSSSVGSNILQFHGIHRISNIGDLSRDLGDALKFQTGKSLCDRIDIGQNQVDDIPIKPTWQQKIACIQAPVAEAGNFNVSQLTILGYAKQNRYLKKTILQQTNSYQFTIVPAIYSFTPLSGSFQGVQLTINGSGFADENTKNMVSVDGTNCIVSYSTNQQIICKLQSRPISTQSAMIATNSSSQVQGFIAGSGMKYQRYDISGLSSKTVASFKTALQNADPNLGAPVEQSIKQTVQSDNTVYGSNFGEVFKGYFLAPYTGEYSFYGQADDSFALYLSQYYGSAQIPSTPYIFSSWPNTGHFYVANISSAWGNSILMNAGEYYYMEVYHIQLSGNSYLSIGAQIPNSNTDLYWQTHEVNKITTAFTNVPEIQQFVLDNVGGGAYNLSVYLKYVDKPPEYQYAPTLNYNATASQFQNALNNLSPYSNYDISVTAEAYDADGFVTTFDLGKKFVYNVSIFFLRSDSDKSIQILFKNINLSPYFTMTPTFQNTTIQQHGEVLNGYFTLQIGSVPVTVINGVGTNTTNIPFDISAASLQSALQIFNFSRCTVTRIENYWGKPEYGATWFIDYLQYNYDVSDLSLSALGLKGGDPNSPPTISFVEVRKYSSNLLLNPIDNRVLRVGASDPQLSIQVNNIKAACIGSCSYSFDYNIPQLTAASLSVSTLTLSVTDPNNVGFTINDITVYFDERICTISGGTISSFTCDLQVTSGSTVPIVRAGDHIPVVSISDIGLVSVSPSVNPITIPLTITSATPSSGNDNGGYNIVVSGTGFPLQITQATVTLCGQNATISQLNNIQFTINAIQCLSMGSDTISLAYNSLTASTSFTYISGSSYPTITSINPNSHNPVLKGVMEIFGTNFGTNLSAISLYLSNSSGRVYKMKALDMNNTWIKAGIPGGLAGQFEVIVDHDVLGQAVPNPSTSNDFTYELKITSISPSFGSYYGGTLINITGINFSTDKTQTQIFVGIQLNWFCKLETVTSTYITCRTPPKSSSYTSDSNQIYLYNKLTQIAECPNGCNFTYDSMSNTINLDSISSVSGTQGTVLSINGSNFNAGNSLEIAFTHSTTGKVTTVQVSSYTDTNIPAFAIPQIEAGQYLLSIRCDPYGGSRSILFTVNMVISTVTPTAISSYGGDITIAGHGLPQSWPATGFKVTLQRGTQYLIPNVVKFTSTSMKIRIPSYSVDTTYGLKIQSPTKQTVSKSFSQNSSGVPELSLASSTNISSLTLANIVINKLNFMSLIPTELYLYQQTNPSKEISINIGNIINSSNTFSFNHNFTSGVYKIKAFYSEQGWTYPTFTITAAATGPITANNMGMSYQGGLFTVTGTQISQAAKIIIAGKTGYVTSKNETAAVFEIPSFVTQETLTQYPLISQSHKITSFTTFSDSNMASLAFDQAFSTFYSSSNSICYFGVDMGNGFKVKVNRIRYFPTTNWVIPQTYLNGANIQASNDNTTWNVLATLDQSVHTGWNSIIPTDQTPYRFVRFSHNSDSSCQLAQFEIYGYELSSVAIPDLTNMPMDVYFDDGVTQQTFTNALTFSTLNTPQVISINPKNGDVFGGYNITISGSNFNGVPTVIIDGVQCIVAFTNSSDIICTVGSRLSLPSQNTFEVSIDNKKAIIHVQFQYVLRWSDSRTWGTDIPPIDGDLVYVPKGMNLLVDQSTPNLTGILVQDGALTFSDESDMQILAGFITITRGKFTAGTQQNPYQHKLEFILYGDYYGKQQPIFGNKGIGCFECMFSMYGIERTPTWTLLSSNISPGDTSFTVQDNVDWVIGEKIVIAPSDFDPNQAQQRIITNVVGKTISIDPKLPFKYKHMGVIENYGTHDLDMRAQVGLLTRNIIVRGDDSSVEKDYGAHLLLAGSAQNGLVGHIGYTQFTKCGQPSILGRYCIHFHLNGDVTQSYVRGNAVHHSMARVITLHGVHFLKVQKNVGYEVKGHNYFLQDGIQTNNVLQYNIAIKSQESFKMLQTDMSVASFWVTNPLNHLRYNRAGGGDFYGFWYEIKPNPDGPSKNTKICPQGMRLGESHDNVAHSYKRFGLRIFKLASRTYPCSLGILTPYDSNNPWALNPTFQSLFYNYVLYKNGQAGLLAQQTGHAIYQNFTIADSKLAGMQFYITNLSNQNVTAKNSAIIGISTSNPTADISIMSKASGIITPRSDSFKMSGIDFYNFESSMVPLQVCSKCYNFKLFINSGRQQFAEKITYNNVTTTQYAKFNGHKKEIIYDLDGSLTNNFDGTTRPAATLINNWKHFENQTNCFQPSVSTQWPNLLVCDETVIIKRVMITHPQPKTLFQNTPMKIQYLIDSQDTVSQSSTDYSEIVSYMSAMQPMLDTKFSYAIPMATKRTYNLWWLTGLDFKSLTIDSSRYFSPVDDGIILKFNYTQNRQLFQISKSSISDELLNLSLTELDPSTCFHGEYYHNINASSLQICISGKERTTFDNINAVGIYCRYLCPAPEGQFVKQDFVRVWSNTTQWPGGVIPQTGENVTIPGQWTIIVDIQPNPMDICQILGDVIIEKSMNFIANGIWIRAGSLRAGQEGSPYTKNLNIILTGQKNDKGFTVDPLVTGNKMLVVNGKLNLYGVQPQTTWTNLAATVYPGNTSMIVQGSSGWNIGDQLVIAPSFSGHNQYERVTILNISQGIISFTPSLNYTHEGDASAIKQNGYGMIDMRAKVGHITRNIKIMAGSDQGWGYRVLVYSFWDGELGNILRTGSVNLYGVQFMDGGQYDTEKSALQFYQIPSQSNTSTIQSCSFVDCKSYCINIDQVSNLVIKSNVFYKGTLFHVKALNIQTNYKFTNNLMIGAHKRPTLSGFSIQQQISCYSSWQYQTTTNGIYVQNNICQGSEGHGFVIPHMSCTDSGLNPFSNNTAGSCQVAFLFNKDTWSSCVSASGVLAYASQIGFMAHPPSTTEVQYSNFMIADCQRAVTLRFGNDGQDQTAYLSNSWISAISRPSCTYCYGSKAIICSNNQGIRLLVVTVNGQRLPKVFGNHFDVICKSESFDAKAFLSGITFENFNLGYGQSALSSCSNNVIFKRHSTVSDLTGSHHTWNSTCVNCSIEAYGKFDPPLDSQLGWFGGCGSILCTGNNNYLIEDHDGSFMPEGGTIIANNSVIGDYLNCTKYSYMNGHHCFRNDLGVLQYESIAPDFNTRIMWPVYLTYGGWKTETNGWKQWQWSGNEPLNKRLGRFTSIIQYQKIFNMTFESKPPQDMILQFQRRTPEGNDSDWIIVKLYYPKPNSIRVMDRTSIIKPIPLLDNSEQANLETKVDICGANKFFYDNYTIHFVITGNKNCQVRVSLTNSIQLTMHFQMSIDQFYSINGQTKLIDRMCALLGIVDQSRVKIVGIYTGSIKIVATIENSVTSVQDSKNYDPNSGKLEIQTLNSQLGQLIQSNKLNQDFLSNGFGPLFSVSHSVYYLEDEQQKQQESSLPIGVIVGTTVGALVLISVILITVLIVYIIRKRSLTVAQDEIVAQTSEENPKNYNVTITEESILDIAEKKV